MVALELFTIRMRVGELAPGSGVVSLILVKFVVPKFASGSCVGEVPVISSIHSAEVPPPLYVRLIVKLWFEVRSEMSIVHVVPETWKMSADIWSPGCTVMVAMGVSGAGRISHHA